MTADADALRKQILDLIPAYHAAAFASKPFGPGQTPVPVSGRVFDAADVAALVDSGLDFWLTAGRFADRFESEFAKSFGCRVIATKRSATERHRGLYADEILPTSELPRLLSTAVSVAERLFLATAASLGRKRSWTPSFASHVKKAVEAEEGGHAAPAKG